MWRSQFTVTTFHDLFVMTGDYSTPEFRERFTRLAKDAAARSDRIISVSKFTATQVHELLGVEWDRLRVIHHGVRMPVDHASPREKIVLHVGAIQKRKNIAASDRGIFALARTLAAGSCGIRGLRSGRDLGEGDRSSKSHRLHDE